MKRSGSFDEGDGQGKRVATSDVDRAVDLARLQHEHELDLLTGGLRRATDKKLVLADRHRKLQIKNINDLFDYEVKDVQAQFDKALGEAKERLEKELEQVIKQLKEKAFACESPSKNGSSSSSSGSGGSGGSGSGGNVSNTSGLEKANVPKGKATSARKPSSSSSSSSSQQAAAAAALSSSSLTTSITQTLSKEQKRADFKHIVLDIQAQAAALGKTKPVPPQHVHVDAHTNTLVVMSASSSKRNHPNKQTKHSSCSSSSSSSASSTNTDSAPAAATAAAAEAATTAAAAAADVNVEHFAIGDMVQVYSPMSGQEFSGLVHSIEQSQIVVRSGHGSFFSFLTFQVASGAVRVRKDIEAMEAADLIAAALKPTAAYSKSCSSNNNNTHINNK